MLLLNKYLKRVVHFSAIGFLYFTISAQCIIARDHTFAWKLSYGDTLQIKKTSIQRIKLNQDKIDRKVVHRVLLNTKKVKNNSYLLSGEFYSKFLYLQEEDRKSYEEDERHTSTFTLHSNGVMDVDKKYYMPNVRNIPSFPKKKKLSIGSTWKMKATEVMEFGTRIYVPIDVYYEYSGKENVKQKDKEEIILHKIIFRYNIDFRSESKHADDPEKILGYNTGIIYWDSEQDIPYFSIEKYNLLVMMKNGDTSEIYIKAKSFYEKIKPKNIAKIEKDIKNQLDDKENPVDIHKDKNGNLKINIPGIFFEHDSDQLNRNAKKTLSKISEILEKEENIQLLIKGYTDSTGTQDYNNKLSTERARKVALYVIENSEIPTDSVSYKGMGEVDPIADNSTPQGRAKNRRVEIIVLRK